MPLKTGLKGRYVYDDAAARVGAFAQTDRKHVARHFEVFDGARQREGIRRHDADVALKIHDVFCVEIFRIDDRSADVCKNFKLSCDPDVVSVAGKSVANDAAADIFLAKGRYHIVLLRHLSDPFIAF